MRTLVDASRSLGAGWGTFMLVWSLVVGILLIALFTLGVMGTFWYTVYAYFEYRSERTQEIEEALDDIVWKEMYHQFLQPLLNAKLQILICGR